jgi:ABC-type lipoprotein release transport system permease subunit
MTRLGLIAANIRRQPRNFILSVSGIVLGVGAFLFFTALGAGVRQNVLQRIFVVDQLEVVPRSVEMGALRTGGIFGGAARLDDATVAQLAALDGVVAVYPKQHLAFPAYASGGEALLGERLWTELIADGVPPELIAEGSGSPAVSEFRDWDERIACESEDVCAPGSRCVDAVCEPLPCVPPDEFWATPTREAADAARDTVLRQLRLTQRRVEVRDAGEALGAARWRVALIDGDRDRAVRTLREAQAPGTAVVEDEGGCEEAPSYCEAHDRVCRMPVPALVSYVLLELYNGNVQSVLRGSSGDTRNLPRLSESALVGLEFDGTLGRGFLGESDAVASSGVAPRHVRFKLVGFSSRAIAIGVTLPMPYIQRWNAQYSSDGVSESYNSIVVVVRDSETLERVARRITDELGLSLDPRHEQSRRASLMIATITGIFGLLSVLIVALAALNVMHTLLMAVAERRREIGVMRAVGATRLDVQFLVVGEAAFVGVVGALAAAGAARTAALVVDALFARYVPEFPFKPETLFAWPPWLWAVAVALAVGSAVFGAWLPALRAAQMDPGDALRPGA